MNMRKICLLILPIFIGCSHSHKINHVSEDEVTMILDTTVHLYDFFFFFGENNFSLDAVYSMNEEFDEYEKNKYKLLNLSQVDQLIPNFKELTDLKKTDGPGAYVIAYKQMGNCLMVKYYIGGATYEGYFLVVYDKFGDIMDYLRLDVPYWEDLVASFYDRNVVSVRNRLFYTRKDTIIANELYYDENYYNNDTSDTIYKRSIQTLYTLNKQTGKFKQISSDTIEKGAPFRWYEGNK
jgi:hypothetical protein